MFTLEQKLDMVMRYIATADKTLKGELKKAITEALNAETAGPDIDDVISEYFKKIGAAPHLVGYGYAISAIKLCMSDPEYLRSITYKLYPAIASQHNTTASRVERAIRHLIEVCFDRGDMDALISIFGNTMDLKRCRLTNSEFISGSVNEIRKQMKHLGVKV